MFMMESQGTMKAAHLRQMKAILRKMRSIPSLSAERHRSLDMLEEMSWARELTALAKLWPVSPELVEAYLDVMVCAMHAFPPTTSTFAAAGAADEGQTPSSYLN
jgi:hypothetical protein